MQDDAQPHRGRRIPPEKRALARSFRRNMTLAEWLLWEQIRDGKLCRAKFRRQHVIAGYIVDFYCHAARLVVEVDGEIHARQAQDDAVREAAISAYGVRIIRFSNDAVIGDMTGVLRTIASALTTHPPLPEEAEE